MAGGEQIGDGPVQAEYAGLIRTLAEVIQGFTNPGLKVSESKVGFVILMFEIGSAKGGRMNYMSNADRENVKTALREQLAYFEGMPSGGEGKA